MRQPKHKTTRLPHHLLDEIEAQGTWHSATRSSSAHKLVGTSQKSSLRFKGTDVRKERRKAARVQRKTKHAPRRPPLEQSHSKAVQQGPNKAQIKSVDECAADVRREPLKSILKTSKVDHPSSTLSTTGQQPTPSLPLQPKPSKGARDRLAADDAEIAALEKALGVKGKKKLPKSFEEDGLNVILEGLDDTSADATYANGKHGRSEEERWLQRKRLKAQRSNFMPVENAKEVVPEVEVTSSDDDAVTEGSLRGMDKDPVGGLDREECFEDFSDTPPLLEATVTRFRENPYIAPAPLSEMTAADKYIPPSAREKGTTASNELLRLRRRMQGLLNRLSDANLLAVLKDFELLYRDNPRQDVSSTLLNLLVDLLADPSALQDTFVILHAGFIAALYKVVGPDFGAQVVVRVDDEFKKLYHPKGKGDALNKKLVNLVTLFAHLYNFRVIGSNLIYDLVRLFIENLSETDTELVLKIARSEHPLPIQTMSNLDCRLRISAAEG
jgi:nucleolar MIF4G domain-containing protein 1